MIKQFYHWAVVSAFLLLSLSTVEAGTRPETVRVVTLYGYAPYCFTTPPGTNIHSDIIPPGMDSEVLHGYSWDVIREALHTAGYTISLSVLPWKRAFLGTLNGEHDILFPATRTPKRMEQFLFGTVPVNDSRALLYVTRDNTIQWQGLENLPPMDVAVQRGFSYGERFASLPPETIRRVPVDSITQGFSMLLSGRVDAFAGYEANWDLVLRENSQRSLVRKLPVFHDGKEYAIGGRRIPHVKTILEVIDSGIEEMKRKGHIQNLQRKWHLTTKHLP